jgi:hypothetical protein
MADGTLFINLSTSEIGRISIDHNASCQVSSFKVYSMVNMVQLLYVQITMVDPNKPLCSGTMQNDTC